MLTKRLLVILSGALTLALGCGDEKEDTQDQDTIITISDMSDMSDDADVDMVVETTPSEQEPNNDLTMSNLITIEQGVRGTISASSGDLYDVDFFQFEAKAGSILTVEAVFGAAFISNDKRGLAVEVKHIGGGDWLLVTELEQSRKVFLPVEGPYIVRVQQLETLLNPGGPFPEHGGKNATYELKLSLEDTKVNQDALVLDEVVRGDLNDVSPHVFPLTVDKARKVQVFTRFFRDLSNNQLSTTALSLWDPETGALVPLSSEDGSVTDDKNNKLLIAEASLPRAGTYWLVLDKYFNPKNLQYQLWVRPLDGTFGDPMPLASGDRYETTIARHEPFDRNVDTDLYTFELKPGEHTKVHAFEDTDVFSTRMTTFRVNEQGGLDIYMGTLPGFKGAGMTVFVPAGAAKSETFLIFVNALQNNVANSTMLVGGPEFKYTMIREDLTLTSETLTNAMSGESRMITLNDKEHRWYEIQMPANSLNTINLDSAFLDYTIVQDGKATFWHSGSRRTTQAPGSLTLVADQAKTILIGMRPGAWGNVDGDVFNMSYYSVDLNTLLFAEVPLMSANTTKATATSLDVTAPVMVQGMLSSGVEAGAAFFTVSLVQGEALLLKSERSPLPTSTTVPTQLTIYNDANKEVYLQAGVTDSNTVWNTPNSYGNQDNQSYAGGVFIAPETGEYVIELEVRSDLNDRLGNGDYVLKLAKLPASN